VAGAAEAEIQRALLVGNYGAALDACLAVRARARRALCCLRLMRPLSCQPDGVAALPQATPAPHAHVRL